MQDPVKMCEGAVEQMDSWFKALSLQLQKGGKPKSVNTSDVATILMISSAFCEGIHKRLLAIEKKLDAFK